MSWFKKARRPIATPAEPSRVPEGLWIKCPSCNQILYEKDLEKNLRVCGSCSHHFRMSAAERLADERYRTGLDTYITVLDSQRSAFQAESQLIAARRLRLENRVDLYLALGGGFEQLEPPIAMAGLNGDD